MQHIAITGASSGIGAAFARCYAKAGMILTLAGRDEARLRAVAEACRGLGAQQVNTVICDVKNSSAMERWLLEADNSHPIDSLIASAGVAGAYGIAPEDPSAGSITREILEVNTLGAINTVAPIVPRMVARQRGHITIISSMAAFHGFPRAPGYCASKAALRVYGQALRYLLLPTGVTVTVACPGFVDTPMGEALPFVGPFRWTTEQAVSHIARAIERKKAEVCFPWQLRVGAIWGRILPQSVLDFLFTRPPGHWLTG